MENRPRQSQRPIEHEPQRGKGQLAAEADSLASPVPELNAALSEGEDRFRKVFYSSTDAILLMDSTAGQFLDANPQARMMFGYSQEEFLHSPPRRLLGLKRGTWDLSFQSLQDQGQKLLAGIPCRHKSGLLIARDILAWPVSMSGKPSVLASVRDTNHHSVLAGMRRSAAFIRFSNAVAIGAANASSAEHAIRYCIHQITDYFRWHSAHMCILAERLLGGHLPRDIWYIGLHGQPEPSFGNGFGLRGVAFPQEWHAQVLATARPLVIEGLENEPYFARTPGHDLGLKSALVLPVLVGREIAGMCTFLSRETMGMDQLFLGILTSAISRLGHVVENKCAGENLRNVISQLSHLQDEERRRVARELHDTTAQDVSAIVMDLDFIDNNEPGLSAEGRRVLSECAALARRTVTEMRTLTYAIYPPMLDELGLVSALRIFIQGFSRRSGIQVNLEMPEPYKRLPQESEVTLFRVVQEGLNNVRRHAQNAAAQVQLRIDPQTITLNVANEGPIGPLPAKHSADLGNLGVGLRSMTERVRQFGGHLSLHVDENRAVLEVVVPYPKAAHAASG